MAYKNNLLEYYGGGSVPYRQGYRSGGMASINRAMNLDKAYKGVQDKAKQVAKKGLFSGLGAIGGSWIAKKLGSKALAGALVPIFGPAAPIIAEMITAGGGAYLGSKAGYGKELNVDTKGWLARDKQKIDKAQLGEKAFIEQGLGAGFMAGAQNIMKSDTVKDIGDSFKQKMNFKPDIGVTPMNAPSSYKASISQRVGSPLKVGSSELDAMNIAQKPRAFGGSLLGFNPEDGASAWQGRALDVSPPNLQDITPYSPEPMLSDSSIGAKLQPLLREGGIVRDDMALLDMILHRR